ncbi:hypothetical protein [Dethiobacter alkaliphilus]|uniref:DUF4367 domain-containing protein n=1 Tax=Dethiobacter alkaliphilus AHT 1 TaxID=555088 RepID=C0GJZ2_DETAL|nr:hypothetical protein [Dethiobacter alkaliphilus]EEG76361.1 conserved hypothetical protein [Dethiobacter alkaliphilus AHT 1]
MDTNKFAEKKITETLMSNSEVSAELKDEIWSNIDSELFSKKEQGEMVMIKKQNRFLKFAVTAAVVGLLFIGAQTETGHALINQVREMFQPERDIVQTIEGQQEDTNLQLNEGSESAYVIYVDEERYQLVGGDESDMIKPTEALPDIYPEVSMEIKQAADVSPEELIKELEGSLQEEFENVSAPAKVDSPVSGWVVNGYTGSEWDSPVIKTYVVSNGQEGSFIITQRYFLEAEEGHGQRFEEMLKEFYIVENPEL